MTELCPFCGEPEELEILEVWIETREFQILTCCEGSYEYWLMEMRLWDRKEWERFFAEEAGLHIRRVLMDSDLFPSWALDFPLRLGEIPQAEAKAFVREHHRHNPPPAGWRWGHAIWNGDDLIGVAMVGRPVARRIDHTTTVEVNRLCVSESGELAWNACSMLYAAAAKEAKRRGFERIITYTLEEEPATALKAVGWEPAAKTDGGSWNRPSRAREDRAPTCRKIRWEKAL